MTDDGFFDSTPPDPKRKLRFTYTLWSSTGAGFGLGVWRVVYLPTNVIWTIAIGPLSIYLRYV